MVGSWSKCKPPWMYRIKVVAIVDPVTLVIAFDLGFGLRHEIKARLFGLKWRPVAIAGEVATKEKAEGWTRTAVYGATHLTAEVFKCGSNAKRCGSPSCKDSDCYCVKVYYDGELLNDKLVEYGYASRWKEK